MQNNLKQNLISLVLPTSKSTQHLAKFVWRNGKKCVAGLKSNNKPGRRSKCCLYEGFCQQNLKGDERLILKFFGRRAIIKSCSNGEEVDAPL